MSQSKAMPINVSADRAKQKRLRWHGQSLHGTGRAILRKACNEWEWIDRAPKVGMLRDKGGRIRSLSRDEFTRLMASEQP